jgi:F-type H+-transporting ATPase subunit epsilon
MIQYKLEIVVPEGIFFSGDVNYCTIPGVNGQFQIFNNHTSLLSLLDIGEVNLQLIDKERILSTGGGMVEIKDNQTNIIVESAEWAEDIDIERAKAAKDRAEKRLESKDTIDIDRAKMALVRAFNRIKIASKI